MGMFDNILKKLGIDKSEDEPAPPPAAPPKPSTADAEAAKRAERAARLDRYRPKKEMSEVDVVSKLEKMAEENPEELNWKTSIVDLLKLLGLDSSYEARVELAEELGCPLEYMDDTAQMNTWLHKTVLELIAENGGNIPPELLD